MTDGVKEFSGSINIHRGWKDYQGSIHNTYHGGHIETYHRVRFSIAEDVEKHFLFPSSITPMKGTLREVLYSDITPGDKISLNGLGMAKDKSRGLSMMLRIGMEVAQYYTVFNYGPPRPQKDLKYQGKTIVAQSCMKPVPNCVLPGHSKEKIGKEIPPDVLIVDNLETSLDTTVDKACDNAIGDIVERFIKPRASTIFVHLVYKLDCPGP